MITRIYPWTSLSIPPQANNLLGIINAQQQDRITQLPSIINQSHLFLPQPAFLEQQKAKNFDLELKDNYRKKR